MTRQKPTREEIHSEILRDLERNPPREKRDSKPPARSKSQPRKGRPTPRDAAPRASRPTLMLRRLRQQAALSRLAAFVRLQADAGTPEILVIVGKGKGSPDGESVLRPAVLAWCAEQSRVSSVRAAPTHEGGDGALILCLCRPRSPREQP